MEPIRFVFPAGESGSALAVCSDPADFRKLWRLFAHSGLELRGHLAVAEAAGHLGGTSIVICDEALPDGSWRVLADAAARLEKPPSIIVISCGVNEQLWADVLNHGGFDVLPRPFSTSELYRVVVGAWRAWKANKSRCTAVGAA